MRGSVLCAVAKLAGATASITVGRFCRSALTATPYSQSVIERQPKMCPCS